MIIPVGINHVIRGWPRVTIALIVTCTLIQVYATAWAPSPEEVAGLIEQRIREHAEDTDASWEAAAREEVERLADRVPIVALGYPTGHGLSWRLLTSAFVHDGWFHLIGNMLFLWLAGAALEDRWGRLRFLGFYLASAAASTWCFDMISDPGTILVGASGAISALMGAFLVCFRHTQIYFAYWFGFAVGTFELAAEVALPLWLVEQLLSAVLYDGLGDVSSIAFSAHIAGFAFGLVVAVLAGIAARRRAAAEAAEAAGGLPRAIAQPAAAPAPAEAAKRPRDPPRPKLEAPEPPPPPRDPGDGPTFLG